MDQETQEILPGVQILQQPEPASYINVPADIRRITKLLPQKIEWVVRNWIVRGAFHIISGEPGSMKSFVALSLAHGISNGLPALNEQTKQASVIYLDRENPLNLIQDRYRVLNIQNDADLAYWGTWEPDQPPDVPKDGKRLLDWASQGNPIMIFDSLVRFHDGEENEATAMKPVMEFFRSLTSRGATVIVLHHQGKAGLEGKHHSPYRGSSEILASCDIAYNIAKHDSDGNTTLTVRQYKNRFGPSVEHCLTYDEKAGVFMPYDPKQAQIQLEESIERIELASIANFIGSTPGTDVEAIRKALALPEAKLRKHLKDKEGERWRTEIKGHGKQLFYPVLEPTDVAPDSQFSQPYNVSKAEKQDSPGESLESVQRADNLESTGSEEGSGS